jgi:hypothetical protein
MRKFKSKLWWNNATPGLFKTSFHINGHEWSHLNPSVLAQEGWREAEGQAQLEGEAVDAGWQQDRFATY